MRQEAWPIASDAWEWPSMAGVLVVHEALVAAYGVLVVVRAWCLRECTMSSCFVLHEVADRFSDLGVGLSGPRRGRNSPRKNTRGAEEWCGDDAFDDD